MLSTAPTNGSPGGRSVSVHFLLFWFLLLISAKGQGTGQITDVSITGDDKVRLVVQASSADADLLYLQEADSPLGPWVNEPDVFRNPVAGGYEFRTPHRP